jgi:two-component system chemotaxis sensor kinase CheA
VSDDFDISSGMPSDDMAEYLQMFVDETSEQLDALVEVLLVLEEAPGSQSHLNESFRLIHSIKGASAIMGLDSITLLTHHLENHFERLRSGLKVLDRPMMELILRCVDFLRDATNKLREGQPVVSEVGLLEALAKSDAPAEQPAQPGAESPVASRTSRQPQSETESETQVPQATKARADEQQKRIIIYFDQRIELPELKAELVLARLGDLGTIHHSSPAADELLNMSDLRTLQIWIATTRSDQELRGASDVVGVEFIEIDLVDAEPEESFPVRLAPQAMAAVNVAATTPAAQTSSDPEPALAEPALAEPAPTELNQPDITKPEAAKPETAKPEAAQPDATKPDAAKREAQVVETVRVDIQRLDNLMNLAGELVVNRARFVQLADQMTDTFKKSGLLNHLRDLCDALRHTLMTAQGNGGSGSSIATEERLLEIQLFIQGLEEQLQVLERGRRSFLQLNEAIDQFARVSDGIQRGVLDTRMVPVGPLFNRFKRTVRDIAVELNKKVNFEIHGESTELDKRMIDELGDPLVHLVRNAIDHGLESESVRRSRGKPEAGTLTLEAVHSGNNVLIYVRDDGGGINVEKVKQRAADRGLATPEELAGMSDHQISQFIWAPGFSTAEAISDISGRGVGMDIVKTRIRELNGTVEVESLPGKGTTFIIRLPLTLAIIQSLLFRLQHGMFAAPIENVREIVSSRDCEVISVHGKNSIEVRGEFIPLIDIDDVFDWHGCQYRNDALLESEGTTTESSVVILSTVHKTMGLLVSELKGCQDLVVKSLDENFTHIRGLAGASILGDGSVCLLLDVVSSIDLAHERLRDRSRIKGRLMGAT